VLALEGLGANLIRHRTARRAVRAGARPHRWPIPS
jgi:hypothetical protein